MPKKLTSLNIRKPGFYRADQNLYLVVRQGKNGPTRSWIVRWEKSGRPRDMGIGRASDYSLSEAREKARLIRQQLHEGVDPIEHRKAERGRIAAEQRKAVSFEEAARGYIQAHLARWVPAHADGWIGSLRDWVHPKIGGMSVAAIETSHVLQVLQQPVSGADGTFWEKRFVTAQRCRSRIEIVLGWAGAQGYRAADLPNPARWRGHLQFLLPGQSKLAAPKPMPALNWRELPQFMARLSELKDEPAALPLQFLIHVAVRTADIARCKVSDVDLEAGIWHIERYSKSGRPLDVPLSPAALALAKQAAAIANGTLLFPVAETVMGKLIRRMPGGYAGRMTPHGARSSFRTWVSEATAFENELAEIALGHRVGSEVQRRYQRGDLLAKRERMMCAWSDFLSQSSAEVVPLKRAKRA
jgi:integrase